MKAVGSFLLFLGLVSCAHAQEEPMVRVLLVEKAQGARVTLLDPCRLVDLKTGAVLQEWDELKWVQVEPRTPNIIKLGHFATEVSPVLLEPVEPKEDTVVRVDGRGYRGSLILHRNNGAGSITIVNRLPLETYLVSALASEVDSSWPAESLKAHAVVSRTMAAHRIWIKRNEPYDMTADTQTHLYYGISSEREGAHLAVDATKGEVLAYQGELLSVTFHANCGGHTEDPWELWETKDNPPPLVGRDDPYCVNLKHYRWRMQMPLKAIHDILSKSGKELGTLYDCQVLERNRSGRVRTIRLRGTHRVDLLTGKEFRQILGANRIRSLKFAVQVIDKVAYFDGTGWGHGVGLCQWGAYGMSKRGQTMDEILDFYFPGAQRRLLPGLPGFIQKASIS